MTSTPETELTRDAFLGGRVMAWQPKRGFRAGVDSVLLGAAVPARAGESVLELGIGPGVASLCLASRVPGLHLTGVELQPAYAALARRNGAEAGVRIEVAEADLRALPVELRQRQFDHVLMNPPYFDRARGPRAADPGRDAAHGGDTPLEDWLAVGLRRLAPRGHLTLIQRTERLWQVMQALPATSGSLRLRPLAGRAGRPAERFLLTLRKGGKAPPVLLPPLVLHAGSHHVRDVDDYSRAASAILRDGAALDWDG